MASLIDTLVEAYATKNAQLLTRCVMRYRVLGATHKQVFERLEKACEERGRTIELHPTIADFDALLYEAESAESHQ